MNKLLYQIRVFIHFLFNSFGFTLTQSSKNFIEYDWCSPIELIYKTHKPCIFVKTSIVDIRFLGVHGYKAGINSNAPFISTLKEYVEGRSKNYSDSALLKFYSKFQPKSIAEYLYLDKSDNEILNNLPASGMILPWENEEPIEKIKQRALQVEIDNKEHKLNLEFSEGDPFYGPVSLEKGTLEYSRLISVYKSILNNGFKFNLKGLNNIEAIILENNNKYCYFIISGQHRVAALSVLGHDEVILQVYKNLIVRRSEAEYWPSVRKGYLKKSEALKVFDRIFSGME